MIATPPAGDSLELIWRSGLLLILLLLSGSFSGSEAVLFSLTPAQLEANEKSANPIRRATAALLRQPKRTLTAILIGNTAVNVLLYANSFVLFGSLAAQYGNWITPLSAVFSILVVIIFGEVLPKTIAVSVPQRLAPLAGGLVHFAGYVLNPMADLIETVMIKPIERLWFGSARLKNEPRRRLSSHELKALLEMSRLRRTINRLEDEFARQVIDLGRVHVRDVMVPRVDVVAYDVNQSADGLRALMRETRTRKVPVYDQNIDEIVGVVYAKMLFLAAKDISLRNIMLPVRFVPEQIYVEQLLHHFRSTKTQFAVVVDEYGGTAGVVTLEDVLEEIVGDLQREDEEGEPPEIEKIDDAVYEINGGLSLHYWSDVFELPRTAQHIATVGGLITAELGRHPVPGDTVQIFNLNLTVLQTDRHRIERVRVELAADNETDEVAGP
ncbi:MAG: hemolysin family protein [Phycisphaerae bacterium]